jgi:hypothetical protein
MSTRIMITSKLNGNVIDIQENSTKPGALLDAFPPKVGQSLNPGPATFAANQTWEVLPDPAGSGHFIIQNPHTKNCIDIQGNSLNQGVLLDAYSEKTKDNQNQLWDFLPDPFGSGCFFIQNPQTGYVIEIEHGSSDSGARLVVNPRRLFDNNFQLWAGVQEDWSPATFKALSLAQPTAVLKDTAQYVLLPKDQSKYLSAINVVLDIIEDLVADSFSVQINGNAPYPPPKGTSWDAQWSQFGLVMQNNSLVLFTQIYHASGPDPAGNPLPSVDELSASVLSLTNNTVPAGTRIVLTLNIDQSNKYVTGVLGQVFNKSGEPIGTPIDWSAIGQPTFHGGAVTESDLSPLGAFQVVIVGAPGGHARFTAGMGTITVICTPEVSPELYWPNPTGGGTGETSNCYYGKVQDGYFKQIAQPFGLPRPKFTGVSGDYNFTGTGLLPNSKLKAKAIFTSQAGTTGAGNVSPSGLTSQNDGSFALEVEPQDPSFEYNPGTLSATITDADGNWASGVIPTDAGFPKVTSTGGLHE